MVTQNDDKSRDPKLIQSVLRAVEVLEVVAQSGSACSISYISAETGIPGPTVFRLLSTLASRGWVIKTAKREYSIGAAFFALTSSAGSSIGSAMDSTLMTLVARTGESASVAMLEQFHAFYVAHRSSNQAMRLFTHVGNRVPLHATGVGKSLLAGMTEKDFSAYLKAAELSALTPNTITSPEALRTEVAQIRLNGFSLDNEEQEIGVRCCATWVARPGNFAVSVSGPPSRMSDDFVADVVRPALAEAVESLTDILSNTRGRNETEDEAVSATYLGLGV